MTIYFFDFILIKILLTTLPMQLQKLKPSVRNHIQIYIKGLNKRVFCLLLFWEGGERSGESIFSSTSLISL